MVLLRLILLLTIGALCNFIVADTHAQLGISIKPQQRNLLFEVINISRQRPDSLMLPSLYGDQLYDITINGQILDNLPDFVEFEIEAGNVIRVNKIRATKTGTQNHISWYGRDDGTEVYASWINGKLRATIKTPSASQNGSYIIDNYDYYEVTHDPVYGPKLIKLRVATGISEGGNSTGTPHFVSNLQAGPEIEIVPNLDDRLRIDVLVLYSTRFNADERQVLLDDLLPADLRQANDVLDINFLNYQFNLVGSAAINTPADVSTAVTEAAADSALASELAFLRDGFSADIVVIYVPEVVGDIGGTPICGGALVPILDPDTGVEFINDVSGVPQQTFTDQAVAVLVPGCGFSDLTFVHELSHTFGMPHLPEEIPPGFVSVVPDAGGFVNPTGPEPASVMDCMRGDGNIFDGVCDRNMLFSNGQTATDNNGNMTTRNNRRLGAARAPVVAGYRPEADPEQGTSPLIRVLFPGNSIDMFQANVFFKAEAIDREDATPTISWRSNRNGSLGQGTVINPPSLSVGEHQITATATDSDGNVSEVTFEMNVTLTPPTPNFGLWSDLIHSETYLALHLAPSTGELFYYWATYGESGLPIWYISDLGYLNNAGLDVELDKVINGLGGSRQRVGDTALRWINNETVALDFDFDGPGKTGVSFLTHRQGVLNTVSGLYYDPLELPFGTSGWGVGFFNDVDFSSETIQLDPSLYFTYDGLQPFWLISETAFQAVSPAPDGDVELMFSARYQYVLNGTCPFCSDAVGPPTKVSGGSVRFNFQNLPTVTLTQNLPFQLLNGEWRRTNVELFKLAD